MLTMVAERWRRQERKGVVDESSWGRTVARRTNEKLSIEASGSVMVMARV